MYFCEALLLATMVMTGCHVAYTDIKRGIISNKSLIVSSIVGTVVNSVYLFRYFPNDIDRYVINLLIILVLALLLYGFHFWAAGDSKLLVCMNLLFPVRIYGDVDLFIAPGMYPMMLSFLCAYGYVVLESCYRFIRQEKYFSVPALRIGRINAFLKDYAVGFIYLSLVSGLLRHCLRDIYYNNQLLFGFLNLFLAIKIHDSSVLRRWYFVSVAIVANMLIESNYGHASIYVKDCIILLLALLLKRIVSGYNYKEIPTDMVEKGMVLAYPTVVRFSSSKIKGLPQMASEDMRSRISQEEADSIRRWKNSKYGAESIVIVRKIPFAIFIFIGELLYYFVRIAR